MIGFENITKDKGHKCARLYFTSIELDTTKLYCTRININRFMNGITVGNEIALNGMNRIANSITELKWTTLYIVHKAVNKTEAH